MTFFDEIGIIELSRIEREIMTPAVMREEAEKNARRIQILVDAGEYEQARNLLEEAKQLCLNALDLEGKRNG